MVQFPLELYLVINNSFFKLSVYVTTPEYIDPVVIEISDESIEIVIQCIFAVIYDPFIP